MKISSNNHANTPPETPVNPITGKANKAAIFKRLYADELAKEGVVDPKVIQERTQMYINDNYPITQRTTFTNGDRHATIREIKAKTKEIKKGKNPPVPPFKEVKESILPERLEVQRFTKEELLVAKNFIKEVGTARAEDLVQTVIEMMI